MDIIIQIAYGKKHTYVHFTVLFRVTEFQTLTHPVTVVSCQPDQGTVTDTCSYDLDPHQNQITLKNFTFLLLLLYILSYLEDILPAA